MVQTVFYFIVGILIFGFLLDRLLEYLNTTRWSDTIPEQIKGIYDPEKYKKQQAYEKVNYRFDIITDSFSFLLMLAMFIFYGFAFVDGLIREYLSDPVWIALVFFGVLMFASDILTIPFSLYGTFVIEERFGFNKTSLKTFILDKLKGWLLAIILGGGILALIMWIFAMTQEYFWLLAWGIVSMFMIFMNMFYSSLIVPLFNKQTALESGPLRDAIENFSNKAGFKLNNIYKIDGSKRSTKANAYFAGFGPKKRIVLYDTLINDLETEELVAVLAHEIGHYKLRHTYSSMIIGILQMGVTFYLLSLFITNPVFSQALGVQEASFHIGLIAFGILYSPISLITGLAMNILSRKNEYAADHFAQEFNMGDYLKSALIKLSVNNLSNLTPHPYYVFFHYSHPTLLQRIDKLQK